jgi:hypothetical protein
MATYDRGDLVRLTATFSVSSVATDPTTVVLYVRSPTGALTTLTYGVDAAITKASTGVYRYDYSASAVGNVTFRWASTGTAQAASQDSFFVYDDVQV